MGSQSNGLYNNTGVKTKKSMGLRVKTTDIKIKKTWMNNEKKGMWVSGRCRGEGVNYNHVWDCRRRKTRESYSCLFERQINVLPWTSMNLSARGGTTVLSTDVL